MCDSVDELSATEIAFRDENLSICLSHATDLAVTTHQREVRRAICHYQLDFTVAINHDRARTE